MKEKTIKDLSFNELSDLTYSQLVEACDEKDWKKLEIGFHLLILMLDRTEKRVKQ